MQHEGRRIRMKVMGRAGNCGNALEMGGGGILKLEVTLKGDDRD